MKVIPETRREH